LPEGTEESPKNVVKTEIRTECLLNASLEHTAAATRSVTIMWPIYGLLKKASFLVWHNQILLKYSGVGVNTVARESHADILNAVNAVPRKES
jgi:hypothetical protein